MAKQHVKNRLDGLFDAMTADLDNLYTPTESTFVAAMRLKERCRKRARYHVPHLEAEALSAFKATNSIVASKVISLDPFVVNNARLFITRALEKFTSKLDPEDVQGTLCMSFLFDNWRFGPGASFEVKGTHTAQKIEQDMTYTDTAESLVRRLRFNHPYLRLKDESNGGGMRLVGGSKLSTVPKNQDTMRTIAIEPSGNMAMQLAAGLYLEESLRGLGLDIRTQQTKNKVLAQQAYSQGLATLDLKSASDMIKPELVRLLFPKVWYELLMRLRSGVTYLPDGSVERLNMISTMGNGFTFPLMTLILASLIYGYRSRKRENPVNYIDWSRTAVFGDDIIVPRNEFDDCVDTLTRAGFVVNIDKSYRDGCFFESCGGDYYKGVEITPFYVKSLARPSEVYVAINQVMNWCGRYEIVLPRTLRYLRSLIGTPFLVPEWLNPDQGVQTARVSRHYKCLVRRPMKVKLKSDFFLTSLAAGGYVESGRSDVFFMPRVDNPRYDVRSSRLPRGFLDGGDPLSRSSSVTRWVELLVQLFM